MFNWVSNLLGSPTARQSASRLASRSDVEDSHKAGPSTESQKKRKRPEEESVGNSNKKRKNEDVPKCPICLKKMKSKENLTATPCAHVFCTICLLTSLEYSNTCPYCRQSFKKTRFNRSSESLDLLLADGDESDANEEEVEESTLNEDEEEADDEDEDR